MFRYYRKLPNEVGRQNPIRLFDMLYGGTDDEPQEYTGDDPHLRMFYGL